jgi:hypothetical protein
VCLACLFWPSALAAAKSLRLWAHSRCPAEPRPKNPVSVWSQARTPEPEKLQPLGLQVRGVFLCLLSKAFQSGKAFFRALRWNFGPLAQLPYRLLCVLAPEATSGFPQKLQGVPVSVLGRRTRRSARPVPLKEAKSLFAPYNGLDSSGLGGVGTVINKHGRAYVLIPAPASPRACTPRKSAHLSPAWGCLGKCSGLRRAPLLSEAGWGICRRALTECRPARPAPAKRLGWASPHAAASGASRVRVGALSVYRV